MRWGAAVVAVLLTIGLAGCSAQSTAPTPAPVSASPITTALSADAAFEEPIVCRAVHDDDAVQTAIGAGDLSALHSAATAAANEYAAGFDQERAHTWVADIGSLQAAYFAKGAEQVQYFRAVAAAKSIDDAIDLQFPDGTAVTTPVFAKIGIPTDFTCPA